MNAVFDGQSLITNETLAEGLGTSRDDQSEAFGLASAELGLILQTSRNQIAQNRDPAEIIASLMPRLDTLRLKVTGEIWRALSQIIQNHEIMDFFLEDPLTRWSFEKPRGYSGDAQLLDYIYRDPSVADDVANASDIGKALYSHTSMVPSCVAARERRALLTKYVDDIAAERGPDTEVLAIAAGHMREANRSKALAEGGLKRWVALDQDPLSVGLIARDFAGTAIETVDGSVRTLLTRGHKLGQFDFIYSSGLYDYLQDKVAIKLTKTCLDMLKPGGTYLFANYAEGDPDAGYRETFMNWVLLLRSEADMWSLVNASVDRNTVDVEVFAGENRNCLYAVIRKR